MKEYESIQTLLDPVRNFGKVTVSTGYTDLDTIIVLNAGDGARLPATVDGQFNLIWYNWSEYRDPADDPNREIVRVTARTGDIITVGRHEEGTTATNKNLTGRTYKMILSQTKKTIDDIVSTITGLVGTNIEAVLVRGADFDLNNPPRMFIMRPWLSPNKLTNPAVLPTGYGNNCPWSPNGEFLAVAHQVSPFITIYQRSGTTFTKLADPAVLPTGDGRAVSWSPNGEFLAVAHFVSPYITIYQRSGTTFTKLSNPATLPAGDGLGCAWSPNGEFLAVVNGASPFITIYQSTGVIPDRGILVINSLGDS